MCEEGPRVTATNKVAHVKSAKGRACRQEGSMGKMSARDPDDKIACGDHGQSDGQQHICGGQ